MEFIENYNLLTSVCPRLVAGEDPELRWLEKLTWLTKNVIGDPHGTDKQSSDDLKLLGYVGVYQWTRNSSPPPLLTSVHARDLFITRILPDVYQIKIRLEQDDARQDPKYLLAGEVFRFLVAIAIIEAQGIG